MKVVLTGGNRVLQRSLVRALLDASHDVRLLSRAASDLTAEWPAQVEPFEFDSGMPAAIQAAVRGADVLIAVASGVAPEPASDHAVSMEPSALAIAAAEAAGVGRLVRIVPNHAGVATDAIDDPHFSGDIVTIGTASPYGIANDLITVFLIMMRSLPAVPIPSTMHVVYPIWHEDLSRLVSATLASRASAGEMLTVRGPDAVTADALFTEIATLIDRRPFRVPVAEFIATQGARLAGRFGLPAPFDSALLSFFHSPQPDGAVTPEAFGVAPTSLREGLQRLIQELPEVTPAEGVGSLEVKRFSAVVLDSPHGAASLLRLFRRHFADVMPVPVGVEPAAPRAELNEGDVVTMQLPGRGHVQVRIEEVGAEHVTVATLRGHALAGVVRFAVRDVRDGVRFEVLTCDAPANWLDWVALTLGGARIQDGNWIRVIQNVAGLAGGRAGEIESDRRKPSGDELAGALQWIDRIIEGHRRRQPRPAMDDR